MAITSNSESTALSLGEKIRDIRKTRKMTITQLANATNLTASMISQVERSLISPSIETFKENRKRFGNTTECTV